MRNRVSVFLMLLVVVAAFQASPAWSIESYEVIVRALDRAEAPLSGAWVKITTQYDVNNLRSQEKQTNASGYAVFDQIDSSLPSAEVRIYWRGVIVAYRTVTLSSGTNEFIIFCNVSNLRVLTVDSNGIPLKAAEVTVTWTTDITYLETSLTNSQGEAVFSQMPHIDYDVSVQWQNFEVHSGTFSLTSSTSLYKAYCQVFSLAVHVVNRRNQNIQGSTVTVASAQIDWFLLNKTGTDGVAVFAQVPLGNYSIDAAYQAALNTTTIALVQNMEVSLKLDIAGSFEVTVRVEWSDGKPVTKAIVTVQNNYGQQLFSEVTDEDGTLTMILSEGAYIVQVVRNALSITQNISVTNQTFVLITFDASLRTYTLTVKVTDERGLVVDNAVVELYQNGNLIASSQTTEGIAIFNVKQGTYNVIAKLSSKQKEKIVEVKNDLTIIISFYESNPAMMLLTYILIPSLIAICVGLLWLFHFKRRNRLF
jgi:hypothetical protein